MKLGTAEPIAENEDVLSRRRRSRILSGGSSGGGDEGGGGSGGSHDDYSRPRNFTPDESGPPQDKTKFVSWFLLLVVLMTFGGMLGAYIVIATNKAAEWQPFALPIQVWLSTILIIASSVTYHFAQRAIFANRFATGRNMLLATTALGAAFISSQILVWLALVNRGLYMRGNPYAGFFYILTAAHAIHVIGGIVALGAILLRSWHDTSNASELEYRRNLARSVGWYWHFMGVLWIVLFIMLGFWK